MVLSSPCCGAASVAGAYNALRNIHHNEKAASYVEVMRIYANIFREMIGGKKRAFQRRLGCASIDELLTDIRAQLDYNRQQETHLMNPGRKEEANGDEEAIDKSIKTNCEQISE